MANSISLERQIHLESFKRYLQAHPDTTPMNVFEKFLEEMQKLSEENNQLKQDYKILRADYDSLQQLQQYQARKL